ncbi:uncharacterized protein LOC128740343 [Sabethes cyaneus]|uniref:uncharacterized protein LOC128740343 n=1 Tax=Sabethes cyaneus TaxID=53552 RepID=UPI00237EA478|nr:uncharacterized protein LOC128740343 [Sabethes cyaneus]
MIDDRLNFNCHVDYACEKNYAELCRIVTGRVVASGDCWLVCIVTSCSVTSEAVCVIAGMILSSIMLVEDNDCYERRNTKGARKLTREETLSKWQMVDGRTDS